jgi:RNA polymerase-binding transcription factor DksA
MKAANRERIEKRLQEERERAMSSLSHADDDATIATDEDGDLSRYPTHPADEGTDTFEQEQALTLLSQESERLALIDDALLRLARDPESFGMCENCGTEIPIERMDLVPWTRYCMDCQAQLEGPAGA